MYTPEENAKLSTFRNLAAAGQLTREQLAEAVAILRQARKTAVQTAGRKKAAASSVNVDALLGELGV